MLVISVGVGTGGSVSVGRVGTELAADGPGVGPPGVPLVAGLGAPLDGAGAGEMPGRAGRDEYCTAVAGCRSARSGAAPIPPAPMPPVPSGAPTEAGLRVGVASVQPIATEIGRPNATSPKKMDLGDNRTSRTPVWRRKRLRARA